MTGKVTSHKASAQNDKSTKDYAPDEFIEMGLMPEDEYRHLYKDEESTEEDVPDVEPNDEETLMGDMGPECPSE